MTYKYQVTGACFSPSKLKIVKWLLVMIKSELIISRLLNAMMINRDQLVVENSQL